MIGAQVTYFRTYRDVFGVDNDTDKVAENVGGFIFEEQSGAKCTGKMTEFRDQNIEKLQGHQIFMARIKSHIFKMPSPQHMTDFVVNSSKLQG